MLKSNFDLIDGKFVGCCIAVQNFPENLPNFHIFSKISFGMFNLCIYLICIQLPRDI